MGIPWGGLALLGAGLIGQKLTSPKQPAMPTYNYKPVSHTMEEIDPGWATRYNELQERVTTMDKEAADIDQQAGRLAAMGDVLMSGEIPQETKDQLEMLAAERAWQGGYGTSERASNTTARDLGLYSLSLIEAGRGFTKDSGDLINAGAQLRNQGSQILANASTQQSQTAAQLAISNANQAFEAYSLKVNSDMARWQTKTNSNNSIWSGIMQAGGMFAMSSAGSSSSSSKSGGSFWSGLNFGGSSKSTSPAIKAKANAGAYDTWG